jgi:nitroreductase
MMELVEAIATRRSVRAYRQDPVDPALLEGLLRQAAAAPSACNRRGWKFLLIESRDDLDWLYNRGGSSVLKSAPQAVLVCYQSRTDNREWQDHIQSASAAIAYFQLLAHNAGIGTCWICHLPPKHEVAGRFLIPATYTPVAVITCGYPLAAAGAKHPDQSHPTGLLAKGRWSFGDDAASESLLAYTVRRCFRAIYYALPFRSLFRRWADRYEKKFDQ